MRWLSLWLPLLLLLAWGCAPERSGPSTDLAAEVVPAATPWPTPTPTPTPTPLPPRLVLASGQARQGTALAVRARPAPATSSLAVEMDGRRYRLVREGEEAVAFLAIALDQRPGSYRLDLLQDGQVVDSQTLEVVDGQYPREQLFQPPSTAGLLLDAAAVQEETRLLAAVHATFTPQRLWQGPWRLPVEGPVSDPFGVYRSINGGPYSHHTGTDLVAPEGTPVVAPAAGRVVLARSLHLRGMSVVLDHGAGVVSGYHHLSALSVQEGQTVEAGQELGKVGATGLAGGPHLHWELVVNGVRVDPMAWLQSHSGP